MVKHGANVFAASVLWAAYFVAAGVVIIPAAIYTTLVPECQNNAFVSPAAWLYGHFGAWLLLTAIGIPWMIYAVHDKGSKNFIAVVSTFAYIVLAAIFCWGAVGAHINDIGCQVPAVIGYAVIDILSTITLTTLFSCYWCFKYC